MNLLKELFAIAEAEVAGDNSVELADLIKHFPTQYKKAIDKLWGGPRLVWNGVPFFGSNDVYDRISAEVKAYKDDDMIEVAFDEIDFEDNSISLNYGDPSNPEEHGQEVYLGYDAKEDCLYIGYDTYLDEEIFNQEWDKAFKDATGDEFDYDTHKNIFDEAWEQYKKFKPWVMFKVDSDFSVEVSDSGLDGFYHEGHKRAKSVGLIDLRLD